MARVVNLRVGIVTILIVCASFVSFEAHGGDPVGDSVRENVRAEHTAVTLPGSPDHLLHRQPFAGAPLLRSTTSDVFSSAGFLERESAQPIPLEEGFRNPPALARPQSWWQPPGSPFTRGEITRELEEFREKGFGGVTLKDTWPMPRDEHTAHITDIPFMSDEWLDMFAHMEEECRRLGLVLRSRSGSGWNEGGPWIPREMSAKALFFAKIASVEGPGKYAGPFPVTEDNLPAPGQFSDSSAFLLAFREGDSRAHDLTKAIADGVVNWEIPDGTWTLTSCFGKPTGKRLMSASDTGIGLHVDFLSTESVDIHIREYAERMRVRLGGFQGSSFDGFNGDGFEFGIATWTPGLPDIFRERCGYDPLPYLPVLDGHDLGQEGERFLYDFRAVVSDLIIENFYRHFTDWCRSRGVVHESQTVGGPSHRHTHDFIKASGAVDIPMGEAWIHGRSAVKMASSAAHAYGKPLVGLEYGTQKPWFFAPSPALLRMRADEAFLLGANYLTFPCVDYTPPEAGAPGWVHSQPDRLGLGQTWWSLSRPLLEYLARSCFLLQSGEPVASVAVYNTFQSCDRMLWAAPDDDKLPGLPRDFEIDYVNDDLIQKHMRVEDGQVVLSSGARYGVLYITPPFVWTGGMGPQPNTSTEPRAGMPLETLVKIHELIQQGATVAWAGELPRQSPSLRGQPEADRQYEALAAALQADPRLVKIPGHDWDALIPIVAGSTRAPAWKLPENVPLRLVHRQLPEADVFFIAHRGVQDDYDDFTDLLWKRKTDNGSIVHQLTRETAPVDTWVTFHVHGKTPEYWWADSGRTEPAVWRIAPEGVSVKIDLEPYTSVFVVFRDTQNVILDEPKGDDARLSEEQLLTEPWVLEYPDGWNTPESITLNQLVSWTELDDDEARHFNGIASYRTRFDFGRKNPGAVHLDLGHVADICEVWLNGEYVGIAWQAPYRLDISDAVRPGTNDLLVRVAAPWHNRLVRDADLPKSERVSRMYPESRHTRYKGRELIEAGLLGPVSIVSQGSR